MRDLVTQGRQFCEFVNEIHQNIKVELRYSKEKIEFLDTMVMLDEGSIVTDLYTKPTDKHIQIPNTQPA